MYLHQLHDAAMTAIHAAVPLPLSGVQKSVVALWQPQLAANHKAGGDIWELETKVHPYNMMNRTFTNLLGFRILLPQLQQLVSLSTGFTTRTIVLIIIVIRLSSVLWVAIINIVLLQRKVLCFQRCVPLNKLIHLSFGPLLNFDPFLVVDLSGACNILVLQLVNILGQRHNLVVSRLQILL